MFLFWFLLLPSVLMQRFLSLISLRLVESSRSLTYPFCSWFPNRPKLNLPSTYHTHTLLSPIHFFACHYFRGEV
uniref:Putative secreted protein n=1 Tax=Anopheles darlingi TaxID=43151 RepID=A0A2M4DDB3_ANODA